VTVRSDARNGLLKNAACSAAPLRVATTDATTMHAETLIAIAAGSLAGNAAEFVVGIPVGAGEGALWIAMFGWLMESGGPTRRLVGWWWMMMGLGICAGLWGMTFGVVAMPPDADFSQLGMFGLSTGLSVTAGDFVLRRTRRPRGDVAIPSGRQPASEKVRSPAVVAVRVVDYLIGATLCWMFIVQAGVASVVLRPQVAKLLSGWGRQAASVGSHTLLIAAGLVLTHVVAAGAIRMLNAALAHGWRIGRTLHYMLLVPPFMAAIVGATVAPTMLAGIVAQLITLYVGWRYTHERPGTTLQTAKRLLAMRRHAAAARVGTS
jgi:hypothetical protein